MPKKKEKTPEQLADRELNKKIAKQIAKRKYEIKNHQAAEFSFDISEHDYEMMRKGSLGTIRNIRLLVVLSQNRLIL